MQQGCENFVFFKVNKPDIKKNNDDLDKQEYAI
jgi:hypothetical protein